VRREEKEKRGDRCVINNCRLLGTPGWEDREKREKGDKRWVREVVDGGNVSSEGIPLPEHYRLDLEKRGPVLNNSLRLWNGMGNKKGALFSKGGGLRGEDKNWLATFTKAGCIACRGEDGNINHRG